MSQAIRRVAVLGAGVMGSGIAAHLANAGIDTLLLDIVPKDLSDAEKNNKAARNRFAMTGVQNALKSKPLPQFMHPSRESMVAVGNFDDDLVKLKNYDLVIEAVVERLDIKRSLFEKVEKVINPNTIIASNTSGLRIEEMLAGRSESFRQHFLVMHFFNPVRFMKLLELVSGSETKPEVLESVRKFGENTLGKGIVFGKDTPNFIGNRIGAFGMMAAIHQMLAQGLEPEDVDAIAGTPMGRPKSAAFRTADIVGIDTFVHVANNCFDGLPNDEERNTFQVPKYIQTMVERKQLGDKSKGGFYKKVDKDIQTLDPKTGEYRPQKKNEEIEAFMKSIRKMSLPEKLQALVKDQGIVGKFAWPTIAKTLVYTAKRIGEISDDVAAIDDAMRWGYNWDVGPFETWDALGFAQTVERLQTEGYSLPRWVSTMKNAGATGFYKTEANGQVSVWDANAGQYKAKPTDVRNVTFASSKTKTIEDNAGASLTDTGDGVFALTFRSKSNAIDSDIIQMIHTSVDKAEREGRGLLIFNEGEHFCVGANLFLVLMGARGEQWEDIRAMAKQLQLASQRMKYAQVPVVAAPYGMTVGGGLEVCLGANNVQAAAETYAGLVEVGVGLIPAGGGCMNLLWRAFEGVPEGAAVDNYTLVTQVFKNIALAKVAMSALEAQELGYFRKTDGVTFDRARHFYEAKRRVIALSETGYHPPPKKAYKLPGASGIATLKMMVNTLVQTGQATAHDGVIATKLAEILCGGVDGAVSPVTEERVLELEVEAFLSLCGEEKSQARMQQMLETGKPLRN